jgi:DNA-binding NarL/FixJ family response regulator
MSREPEATVPRDRETSREFRTGSTLDALERGTYDPTEEGEGMPMKASEPPASDPPAPDPPESRPESQAETQQPARSRPLRVVVVDDHPMYRDGLCQMLAGSVETEPVGEAATGEEAVETVRRLRPDLVLMDLRLPGMSGVEATRRILDDSPGLPILVLSMLDDDDSVFAAMRAGARGYLLKGADRDELLQAIRAASLGEVIFGASIARRVMAFFAGAPMTAAAAAFPELTDREREILERIARGEANPAIARAFGLTEKTVRNNVSNILNKLQVADRAGAIVRARDAGLGNA